LISGVARLDQPAERRDVLGVSAKLPVAHKNTVTGWMGPLKRPSAGVPLGGFRGGNPLERFIAISDN
jgi:hypothetical protein